MRPDTFLRYVLASAFVLAGTGWWTTANAQQTPSLVGNGTTSVQRFDEKANALRGGGEVLFDQTDNLGQFGFTSQEFEAENAAFDNQGADDFVVPAGATWTITEVFAPGEYFNGVGPAPLANVYFYDDNAGAPGAEVASAIGVADVDLDGDGSLNIPVDVVLTEGTYWVSVQADMDFGAGGQWGWIASVAVNGAVSHWRNPGGGFGTTCADYDQRVAVCGVGDAASGDDAGFTLTGTSETGGGGATSGGPDAFGYTWVNSNDPEGPAFDFVDISGTGTELVLGDDEGATVDLPFTFSFYGNDQESVTIGSNGYLTFGADGSDFSNDPIPDPNDPNDLIAPFWDDFDPSSAGTIYYQDMGDGRFIAQWNMVPRFSEDTGNTFQAILSQSGDILYQYLEMTAGTLESATIGIENADATDGLQVAFNEPFVEDNLAVRINAPAAGEMTIAEARAAGVGATVTVTGTVTRAMGSFTYFQDDTAGLVIRQTTGDFFDDVADGTISGGTEITVTGTLSMFRGLLQINEADLVSYTVGEDGDVPDAQEVSVQDIVENGEDYESELVRIDNLTIDGMGTFSAATSYTVTDETASDTLRIPNADDSAVDGLPIPDGEFTFTGVIGQFDASAPEDEGYQLLAIEEGDIEVIIPGAIEFDPSPLVEMLESGETGTETVTITNNTDSDVTYDFTQYSGDPRAEDLSNVAPAHGQYSSHLDLAKGQDDPRRGSGQNFGAGGPDDFGYRWIDSNEPGGPTFDFVDISGTGTAINLGDDDSQTVDLPFTFSFYGNDQESVTIGSNGFLTFGGSGTSFINDPIPTPGGADDNIIAPFWDDLNPSAGGSIYYQDMGDGRFIVMYDGVPFFGAAGSSNTFEVILNQSGSILYQYEDMDDRQGATVGIENADGTDGLQIAFDEPYVEDGLAVLISIRPLFVTDVDPATGTISAGGSVDVDVTFDATGLNAGTYEGTLVVETDLDSDPSTFELPVRLIVTGQAECAITLETITFDDTIIGDSTSVDAFVMNGGTDSCTITGVSATDPFSVEGSGTIVIAPGDSTAITIVYTPTEAGDDTGTLTVTLEGKEDLTATLEGSALEAPTPEADPDALSFDLVMGATESQTFTLSNTGGANAADLEYEITVMEVQPRPAAAGNQTVTPNLHEAALTLKSATATGNFAKGSEAPSAGPAPEHSRIPEESPILRGGESSIAYGHDAGANAFVTFDFLTPAAVTPISTIIAAEFIGAGALGASEDVAYQIDGRVLYSVDTATGVATQIGTLATPVSFSGMTFDPTTSTYYGITTDVATTVLYEIDVETATATLVGTVTNAPGGIALAAAPDGKLYTYDIVGDVLLQVNKETGAGTVIGSIGFDANFGQGMTYDYVNDAMTMAAFNNGTFQPELRTVDLATGNSTLVGVLGAVQLGWVGASSAAGFTLVAVSPNSGSIAPGESDEITVTVDATDVEPGTYNAEIIISTNDPNTPTVTVDVTVEVRPFVSNEDDAVPTVFALRGNYPNPFASATTIEYDLPEATHVTIEVYDAVGRRVATLVNTEQGVGRYKASWNASNLASGVYLYRIQAGDYTKTMKMSIVR